MSDDYTQTDSGRNFAPDARYAAADTPGVRFVDEQTGQMSVRLDVSAPEVSRRLRELEAERGGVDCRDDEAVVITGATIQPYQPPSGRWKAEISLQRPARTWHSETEWEPEFGDAAPDMRLYEFPKSAARCDVFDDRDDAVEWIAGQIAEFESLPVETVSRDDGDDSETAEVDAE